MEKIYLAMYSFGMESTLSLEEKLKMVSDIGFAGIEFFGDFRKTPVEEMKSLLEKYHLEGVSAHVNVDDLSETIPYMAAIGGKMLFVPMRSFANKEEALDFALILNKFGQEAAPFGLKIGYHNHTFEFYEEQGKYLMDYVIENTNPEFVSFELDCGWASAAGINPAEYIRKYSGRFVAIHVKENSKVTGPDKPRSINEPPMKFEFDENGIPIFPPEILAMFEEHDKLNVPTGTGIVDWHEVTKAAVENGCDTFIIEREWSYNQPPDRIACIKEDFEYVKKYL